MSKIPELRDAMGNIVDKDNLVIIQAPFPIPFKVVVADRGGLMTPQGETMALLRLVADINLRQPPRMRFFNVIRVIQQSQEEVLSHILDSVGGPPRS